MGVYEEYRQRVNKRLNVAERIHGLVSSTDDRIDELAWLTAQVVEAIQGIVIPQPGPGPGPSPTPYPRFSSRLVSVISNYASRALDTINPSTMADCRAANRVVVIVSNNLDVRVRFEVIGHTSNDHSGSYTIVEGLCASSTKRAYLLKSEEWLPYIGVRVTPLVAAPTAGAVDAAVIVQE